MTDETQASPPEVEETQEPASTGIDAAIDRAVASIESRTAQNVEDNSSSEPAKKGNPYRAPDGKFTSKDNAIVGEAPVEAGPAEPTAEPAETPVAPEPAPQPLEAPARWSDADKAAFAQLPREAQQMLLERYKPMEADYTRKTQEVAEYRKAIEPLVQTVSKHAQHLRSINITPDVAFDQAMQIDQILRHGTPQQKMSLVAEIAQFAGLQLPTASGEAQPQGQVPQEWVDPQVQQLSQTVQGLQQHIEAMRQQADTAAREQAHEQFARIGQTKNSDGSAKYPHFDRVRSRMVKLVRDGDADTWDDAYDMSVWADRELRTQMVAAEKNSVAEAERQAEEKRRTEAVTKAKGAAPVVTSHGVKGGTKPKGLDALLEQTLSSRGYQ